MQHDETINKLKTLSNPEAVEGMVRFGINPKNTYGVSIPNPRKMASRLAFLVGRLASSFAKLGLMWSSHELQKLLQEARSDYEERE